LLDIAEKGVASSVVDEEREVKVERDT